MELAPGLKLVIQNLGARAQSEQRPVPALLWDALRRRLWYRREKRIYLFETERVPTLPTSQTLRRDHLDDLRFYERTALWQMAPDQYRTEACLRLARGEHLYTLVQQNRLLHYAWLIPCHTRGEDQAVGQAFVPPPGSSGLYDHFTHPAARGRGLFYQAICQLLHDVVRLTEAQQAYISVYADNGPSRHVIEKVGFRYAGSLVQERRLWAVRRYDLPAVETWRAERLGQA